MTNIFDQIAEKNVYEPALITCPFCNCTYVHTTEYRPLVKCSICKGNGYLAKQADMDVESTLTNLNRYSTEQINQFIKKLGSGFYRTELRTFLNKRKGI